MDPHQYPDQDQGDRELDRPKGGGGQTERPGQDPVGLLDLSPGDQVGDVSPKPTAAMIKPVLRCGDGTR
jgi:hypothetical protein